MRRSTMMVTSAILSACMEPAGAETFGFVVCPKSPENPRNSAGSVVELRDGSLLMSYSSDGGVTWSEGEMIEQLPAPQSPQTVKRIPSTGDLLIVWNRNLDAPKSGIWRYGEPLPPEEARRRIPLTSAISRDDGQTWQHVRNIEDGPRGGYAYTSMAFLGDDVLLTYSGPKGIYLRRLPVAWFYGQ